MKKFEFAIIASGLDHEAENFEDLFYEAGCADATLSFQKGVIIVEFNRRAVSFSQAVISACQNILDAGAKIERIEPDHLVSLSEISDRCALTKQAISLYGNAKRGSEFPNPVAKITSKHPLYDWSEVAEWLYNNGKLPLDELVQARIVKEANVYLESSELPDDNFTRKLEALEIA
ncbi:MAG: helix-turn-helix transcriptional regulator [Sphingomicrobium sp.]